MPKPVFFLIVFISLCGCTETNQTNLHKVISKYENGRPYIVRIYPNSSDTTSFKHDLA